MRCSKTEGDPFPWNNRRDRLPATFWRAEMRRRQFIAGLGAEAWAVVDLARTFGIDHATLYRMQALASALKVGSEGGTDD
jgi:transcriptional regulator of acetoin/glycerol metabolism